jgi:hypothetical protein
MALTGRRAGSAPAGDDLVGWRIDRLRVAGLDDALAGQIARDGRYDLHELLELIDRGCPPPLAARILAPIDDPEDG